MPKEENARQCRGHKGRGPSSYRMHNPDDVFAELKLKPGSVFLDLGCGPGEYAVRAAGEVGPSGLVYAFDRWEESIGELLARGLDNVVARSLDIVQPLPLEAECVDVCLLATVLHSIDLPGSGGGMFREVLRVLKPGGRLAIIECHKRDMPFGPPKHVRLSVDEVEEAAKSSGFVRTAYRDLGHNYLVQFVPA